MSYFSNALSVILEHTPASTLAVASGLSESTISRYKIGERGPKSGHLSDLVDALPFLDDRWELVKGYLLDKTPEIFIEEVSQKLSQIHYPKTIDPHAVPTKTNKRLTTTLEKLRLLGARDESVEELLVLLAEKLN